MSIFCILHRYLSHIGKGHFLYALKAVYPRPLQKQLSIWLGVGGTPESFVRAGTLGVAVIGGETHRFRPLVDLYREAGKQAEHEPESLKVGLHSLGYVAPTTKEAIADFYQAMPIPLLALVKSVDARCFGNNGLLFRDPMNC